MAWAVAGPGLYQRPMGENESFIKLIGDRAHSLGREHWSVTSTATLHPRQRTTDIEVEQHCHNAWRALRFEHPSIASVAGESSLTYEVPDGRSLRAWLDSSFTVHPRDTSVADVMAELRPSPYATAHLILDEPTILLHFPHWRTDGYGALQILNSFLTHLALSFSRGAGVMDQPVWGQEVSRLAPSLEEALGLPSVSEHEVVATANSYLAKAALIQGAVGVEAGEGTSASTPRGTHSYRKTFSVERTTALIKASTSMGLSIYAAVHAACAAATYSKAPKVDLDKQYTSTMRFSLRPFLPIPFNGPLAAAGLYTGGYMTAVPASQSFLDNAQQYNMQYEEGPTHDFLQSRREYARACLKLLSQVPPPPPPSSSAIDISTVEGVDQMISSKYWGDNGMEATLDISDVSVGVETLSRQIYCFVWIFGGRLELNMVFNKAFYDEAFVEDLTGILETVLASQLGV